MTDQMRPATEAEHAKFAQLCLDYPVFKERVLLGVEDVDTPTGIRFWVATPYPFEEPI